MKASEEGFVNSFIICPSAVFGTGSGFDRKVAWFFPSIFLEKRQAFYVGEGSSIVGTVSSLRRTDRLRTRQADLIRLMIDTFKGSRLSLSHRLWTRTFCFQRRFTAQIEPVLAILCGEYWGEDLEIRCGSLWTRAI